MKRKIAYTAWAVLLAPAGAVLLASVLVVLLAPAWAAGAEGAADAHGAPDPLVPPTVWSIVAFLAVLFILWKKLMPQITAGLDKRAAAIRDSLAAADKAKADAEAMMEKHQQDLEQARQEARAIIEEGKRDAEAVKDRIVADARREAEEISQRAQREIELAKGAALEDLHHRSVQLSFDLATLLIEKNLSPEEHQDLIRERISQFETRN